MTEPLIKVRNISKNYYIKKKNIFNKEELILTALKDIDLDIYEGEVLGLVGESGSGKTTLGHIILQLIKEDSGKVFFNDIDLTELKGNKLREFRKNMLTIVGLSEEYLDRYPSELSGGQAQRVSILSALIIEPKFVVADEAVSALDVSIQAQILNLFNDLKDRLKLTTLFITHDLSVCYYMSDRIAVMYLGI